MLGENKDIIRYTLAKKSIEEVEKLLKEGLSYRKIRDKTGVNICSISQIKNKKYKFKEEESWFRKKVLRKK